MCRNIRKLRQPDQLPTEQEVKDAALQFVRKVSGYRKPSRVNERAFNDAVIDIAEVTLSVVRTPGDSSGFTAAVPRGRP